MSDLIQNVELTSRGIKKVLNRYTPERAIAEYIWNGFDANATSVKVSISIESDFLGITDIMIEDNGNGIVYEELPIAFKRFYESQKALEDNNDSRFSRGKNGYGRFTFFKLCRKAKWETSYQKTDCSIYSYEITMESDNLTSYSPSVPESNSEAHIGTTVYLYDFSDSALSQEWVDKVLIPYLRSEFAWYFKVYPDKRLYINEELLDCSSIIADHELFDIPIELQGVDMELFHCTYFQWAVRPQDEFSRFYFIDTEGNLISQRTTSLNKKGDAFWHSVLVKSTFFNHCQDISESDGPDLFSSLPERKVMKALGEKLNDYLRNKRRPFLKNQAGLLVGQYEKDNLFSFIGSNPWDTQRKLYLQDFIKELYEVEPAVFMKLNEAQKKIFIRLLDQVMDSNNDNLFKILGEIVDLDEADKSRFAKILESTRLKNVISTIQLIEDRLDTIQKLRAINFDHTLKAGEVAHLQKLIEYHYWIFGEEYRFVCAEEVKFQEALERYHYILRGIEKKEYLQHPDRYKEMDLFITGKEHRDGRPSNLVVEIKNPTTVPTMTMDQYSQIIKYMNLVMKEDVFNANGEYWTFMLVGLKIDDTIVTQMRNKETGLCTDEPHFKLYVKTWSQVLNEAEDRMNFLKENLQVEREKLASAETLEAIMFSALHNSAIASDVH